MRTITRRMKLHPIQHEFRSSSAIYRGFCGGRGAGKTWVGAYDLLLRTRRGRTYLVASPTGVLMGDTTYPTFKKLAEDLSLWHSVKLTPYPNATLANGATVRFRTAEDPEKMRGPNLSGVWLDEASLMKADAYTIAIASLREGGDQGWMSGTFTPKGQYHWTYDTFAKNKPNTELFRARTGDNPFNPAGFESTLAEQYTELFARQELGGEFLNIEGAEWGADLFPDSIWFDQWPEELSHLVIGLDPSKGKTEKADYSALVGTARDGAGVIWVEADLERRHVEKIIADGIAFARRLRAETRSEVEGFGVEGDAFQELLADQFIPASVKAGFPLPVYKVFSGGVIKDVRIRRLTYLLTTGRLRFRRTPGTKLLVQQMQEFPVGKHDDGLDGLEISHRLGNQLLGEKQRPTR